MGNPKKRKPWIAFLLSCATLGLGQLYNGQWKRAILLWIIGSLIVIGPPFLGAYQNFYGFVLWIVFLIGFFISVLLDARKSAIKLKEITPRPFNKWYVYLALFLINLFLIQPLISFVVRSNLRAYRIPASSMEPALIVGDHFIAGVSYYKRVRPERGDVIVFPNPKEPSRDLVRRVIGLESEKVEILHDKIYINDKLIEDPWGSFERKELSGHLSFLENFGPVVVSTGSLFVLGDNRHNSQDSRFWGFVDLNNVRGKALYIYWAKDKNRIGNEINPVRKSSTSNGKTHTGH
jgi:signal peptidase I